MATIAIPPVESINQKTRRLTATITQADLDGTLAIVRGDHAALVDAWNARIAASTELLAIETTQRKYLEAYCRNLENKGEARS